MENEASQVIKSMRVRLEEPRMLDLTGVDLVQIQISSDGKTLWVNTSTEGACILRICKIGKIEIEDHRTPNQEA